MNIRIPLTTFRRMIRPLSVYSTKSRTDGIAAEIKWEIGDSIGIYGYHPPDNMNRLTLIQLHESIVENINHSDFISEVPQTRGLGTATDGRDLVITTDPGQNRMTIQNEIVNYNAQISWGANDMLFRKYYLPIKEIDFRESIRSETLQSFLELCLSGPLKLTIDNNGARFVTEGDTDEVKLKIDNNRTSTTNKNTEYKYNLYNMREMIRKYPSKGEIEVIVNDELIGFQYTFSNNIGKIINYVRRK